MEFLNKLDKFDDDSKMKMFKQVDTSQGDYELYYEKDLGTTIMAIVYDGGVMLAADSRTSSVHLFFIIK